MNIRNLHNGINVANKVAESENKDFYIDIDSMRKQGRKAKICNGAVIRLARYRANKISFLRSSICPIMEFFWTLYLKSSIYVYGKVVR